MSVQLNYTQNQVLNSRNEVDYNLFQGIGPRTYNTIDTQSTGMASNVDQFIITALGSHWYLRNPQYTLNLTIKCHGTSVAQTGANPEIPPIVFSSFAAWLDTDAGNKAITDFTYSGAVSYRTNDQLNRNPDTREIISHTYNKDQCDKYHYVRSPQACSISNAASAASPLPASYWEAANVTDLKNPLLHYTTESLTNYPRKLNTSSWVVKSCTASVTGTGAPLSVINNNTYFPGEFFVTEAGTSTTYIGAWSAVIQVAYTFPLCDKFFDCIYNSEDARSILINNQDLTLNVNFDTNYISNWLIKAGSTGTVIDSVSKSTTASSSIRHYGFTTPLPSTPLFTKPFYDWANVRTATVQLVNGTAQFTIDMIGTDVLPPQYIIYGSLELWKGSNSGLVSSIIGDDNLFFDEGQVVQVNNINNLQLAQITGLRMHVDTNLVSDRLDDAYFQRMTAEAVINKDGTYDEELYQKLTQDYYTRIYSTDGILPGQQGGVPYLVVDTAKLSLDGRIPLVRNSQQRVVRFSGNLALDPTSYTALNSGVANPFANAVVQLYIYELRPSLLTFDPERKLLSSIRLDDQLQRTTDLEVQNQMQAAAAAHRQVLSFGERIGGSIGGAFWDRVKEFVQPLIKPVLFSGIRHLGQYFRDNGLFSGAQEAARAFTGSGKGGAISSRRRVVI